MSVISTIVLAWLLTPKDFGIVAMASIVTTLMTAFTEVGMNQVIVYYRDTSKAFYDTAWTIQLLRGIFLALILFLFADVIASFFGEEQLIPVLRVLSVVFVLNGMISIGMAILQKEMRFDIEFRYRLISRIVGLISAIALALWLRNYWAMILSNVMFALSCVVLSFLYAPRFPSPTLLHWHKIFNFSQWVFLREASGLISQKLDQILLGRWLGSAHLGQYDMATQVATLPSTEIAMPLSRSLLPALAGLQDQPDKFRQTLSSSLAAIILVGLPASCGLIMISKSLVSILLPPAWEQAGILIPVLAIYGLVRIVFGPCTAAFSAMGKVREVFFISITNLLLKFVFLYFGYKHAGLLGIAWGTVVSSLPITLLYLGRARYHNFLHFSMLLGQIWRPILASGIMIPGIYGVQSLAIFVGCSTIIEVIAMVLAGIAIYIIALLLFWWASGKPDGIETQLLRIAVKER